MCILFCSMYASDFVILFVYTERLLSFFSELILLPSTLPLAMSVTEIDSNRSETRYGEIRNANRNYSLFISHPHPDETRRKKEKFSKYLHTYLFCKQRIILMISGWVLIPLNGNIHSRLLNNTFIISLRILDTHFVFHEI